MRPLWTRRVVLPGFVALLMVAALLLALRVPAARSQESDESLLEQELARSAELLAVPPTQPLPHDTLDLQFPLFMGVDDTTVPAYTMDPSSNISTTAFSGFQVWGAAYDSAHNTIYFSGGSQLYAWPVGGSVNLLGTIVDAGAATQSIVSLAFHNGQLYGTKNIANEAIWAINTSTLVATVHVDYVDADLDLGGLAVDPATGDFYATNDDTTPYGSGLVRIEPGGSATLITPYPAGQTDIDGLAIGPDRRAYLITDEPGFIYVYDLVANAYLPPLTNPWTTSEVFSGGAFVDGATRTVCSAPALAIPDNVPAGVSDALTFDGSFTVADLDVFLQISHTWVGDLRVTLTHQDSGVQVPLVDRPGVPASTFGCSGNDVDATVDDEGADGNVETSCGPVAPTIAGNLVGGDPPDSTLLAAFDGENLAGTWTLSVSDNAGGDTGVLDAWCLVATGGQPSIAITPASLQPAVAPAYPITRQLTISNAGAAPLTWTALEESTSIFTPDLPALPAPGAGDGATLSQQYAAGTLPAPAALPAASSPILAVAPAANGPVYYDDRAAFDAAFPGLPVEDFEDGLWADGEIRGCPAPFNAATNNSCFAPGAILPGVSFQDNPLNDAGGGSVSGLAGVGAGAFVATSKLVVANSFPDAFEINFDPPVNAAAMDLHHLYTDDTAITVMLYDASDALIAATAASATNAGNFWGVYATTPIARISIHSPYGAGDGAEGVDNVAFGVADVCDTLDDLPWLGVNPISGTVPAGSSMLLDVTFDAAGLPLGDYHGALCFNSNDPQQPLLRVPLTMTVDLPSITLTKTVGLDPTVCAAASALHVPTLETSVDVTYCYRVVNTGPFTLTTHDLVDDRLGAILTDFPYSLAPGATAFLTTTATLTSDTVNEATWTAAGSHSPPASATASAGVTIGSKLYLPFIARASTSSTPFSSAAPPLAAILQQRQ